MPNPKFRGIVELSMSVVLTILLIAAAALLLGLGAMWAYGEMQKADHMRIQALMSATAVLDGDVFAVQFSQPVVVEQIGYGWYDGRTGQEVGVQFRDVGSSGKYFSWRLDRADYNLTYVIAKDPNSDVRKIFRWRFIQLSSETQAAMAAQFSDVFSRQYASQYAQQYAQQYASQYAQQIQQQLQNYVDQVIQQQLGSGVIINSNPDSGSDGGGGSGGGGGGGTPPTTTTWVRTPPPTTTTRGGGGGGTPQGDYVAYVTVRDSHGEYIWRVSSSVDSFEVRGSVSSRHIRLGGSTDTIRIEPVRRVLVADFLSCRMEPTSVDAVAGGHYTFTYTCTPVDWPRPREPWDQPPPPTTTTWVRTPPPTTTTRGGGGGGTPPPTTTTTTTTWVRTPPPTTTGSGVNINLGDTSQPQGSNPTVNTQTNSGSQPQSHGGSSGTSRNNSGSQSQADSVRGVGSGSPGSGTSNPMFTAEGQAIRGTGYGPGASAQFYDIRASSSNPLHAAAATALAAVDVASGGKGPGTYTYTFSNDFQALSALINPTNPLYNLPGPLNPLNNPLWSSTGTPTKSTVTVSPTDTARSNNLVAGKMYGNKPGDIYYNPNAIKVHNNGDSGGGSSGRTSSSGSSDGGGRSGGNEVRSSGGGSSGRTSSSGSSDGGGRSGGNEVRSSGGGSSGRTSSSNTSSSGSSDGGGRSGGGRGAGGSSIFNHLMM